ncbi:MAG: DUF7694 domain-containing protein [Bdellovibrionota bacterium]
MRAQFPEKLENGRLRDPIFANATTHGPYGVFIVQGPCGCELQLFSHPRDNWEHVSVDTGRRRSPNWQEMCFVKDLFWDEEECVVQYHPALSQYVKMHRYRLHLWKPKGVALPAPPSSMVGIVGFDPELTHILFDGLDEEEKKTLLNEMLGATTEHQ